MAMMWRCPVRWLPLLLAAALLGNTSCRRKPVTDQSQASAARAAAVAPAGAGAAQAPTPPPFMDDEDEADSERPTGAPAAAPGETTGTRSAANTVSEDDDEGEDSDTDHWKNVQFDVANFDEVLDYVATYYIDGAVDKKRPWIEAANFALMSLEPSEELLPSTFFAARKGIPEEEGRLDGKTDPFACSGAVMADVVLHHLPADDYLKAHRTQKRGHRLSNEEVQVLRDRQKARNLAYNEAWKNIPFGRQQFECVMTYAQQNIRAWQAKNPAKVAAAKAAAKAEKTPKPEPKADAAQKAAKLKADDDKRLPPDLNRAWLAAASGYLYALDPHSAVIARAAWDESTRQTQDNSFEGIGAVLTQRDDQTIVENPMEGRPAWRSGVKAGDVIHKVDGVDVSGWMLGKVVKLIRGPKQTKVVLTITREAEPEPKEYSIVREAIDIKNVDGKLVPEYPGVAHIKMNGFIPHSTRDLRDMIEKLRKEAPGGQLSGLILDLRNNSGGLLNKAIEIADMFLSQGRIVSVKSRKRTEEVHDATASSSDYRMPMVVLVNDSSASASEIVASAIQDNARGLVVGLRTFGKASVQTLFEPALHQDYYIKLTVARYYAPNGTTIQVVGVTPDVVAAPEADGKIPVGFREENLNNHLVPIESAAKSPFLPMLPSLQRCVDAGGQAEKIAKHEPKPQIHPDFQMLRAADYLTCLARQPVAAAR